MASQFKNTDWFTCGKETCAQTPPGRGKTSPSAFSVHACAILEYATIGSDYNVRWRTVMDQTTSMETGLQSADNMQARLWAHNQREIKVSENRSGRDFKCQTHIFETHADSNALNDIRVCHTGNHLARYEEHE